MPASLERHDHKDQNRIRRSVWLLLVAGSLIGCVKTPAPAAQDGGLRVRHADPAAARALIRQGEIQILDVRTPDEFKAGSIEGAANLDVTRPDFEERLDELDRSATYLVYCRSGNRSARAVKSFERLGFRSVVHLDGGLGAWNEADQPLQR